MTRWWWCALAACAASTAFAADFQLLNLDGPTEGFNDPAPVERIGNNTATTLGGQRLQAFEFTLALWGAVLESDVTIVVAAEFSPAECAPDAAVLGFAGPNDMFADFPGAPLADTWYASALADRLAGFDQAPGDPDILLTINSAIDESAACLEDTVWYYGFDGPAPEGTLDVVETILHELAHGLGFLSFANQQGQFPGGTTPDIFSRFLFDLEFGEAWPNLSSVQRQTSSVNDPNLVWTGDAVTERLPDFLESAALLMVESPASIAGMYDAQSAQFGPRIPTSGLTGPLALANDGAGVVTDGCEPLIGFPDGAIALIDRGDCFFTEKVAIAQAAGAAAVIIANNEASGLPPMGGEDETIAIPSLGVSMQTGQLLRDNLGPSLMVTLGRDPDSFSGTNAGFLRLHAPVPFESGSSVSHWTSDASPDLLMEPSAGFLVPFEVDLTIPAFQDLGWTRSPVFTTQPPLNAAENEPYEYTARIGDPDVNDTLQLQEVQLPAFLSVTVREERALTLEGTPETNDAGAYRTVLRASDSFGNVTLHDFTILVQGENDPPVFVSLPNLNAVLNQPYLYAIEVTDADPGDVITLTAPVLPDWLSITNQGQGRGQLSGTPGIDDVGPHGVTLRAEDSARAAALQPFTVTVAGGPPVITLNGAETITHECHDTFNDPGAVADDPEDGLLTPVVLCNVDVDVPGEYTCTYSATDSAGNEVMAQRTVTVVDTQPPVVMLNGAATVELEQGMPYTEEGATAADACDGDLVVMLGGGLVNSNVVGIYEVEYRAIDAAGNMGTATRTVVVEQPETPNGCASGTGAPRTNHGDIAVLAAAAWALAALRRRPVHRNA